MSFTFGGASTTTLAGVTATLIEWPSLGGQSVESIDTPGRDGRFFAGSSRLRSAFTFDVVIEGATPTEVAQRRDNFVGLIDPSRGPQDMIVGSDTQWLWRDVIAAAEVNWSRVVWEHGTCILRADVAFETQADPSAREVEPEVVSFTGSTVFTRTIGNTASFPRLFFYAVSGSGQPPWTVTIGDFILEVSSGIASGQWVSLDWDALEFYLTGSSGVRVASLVPKMSHYDRPRLMPGQQVTVSVDRAGTPPTSLIHFYPNNRRV